MEKLRNYEIQFSGLSLGKHAFDYQLKQSFFDLFEFEQEFRNPDIAAEAILEKKSSFLELHLKIDGNVEVDCDISNLPYQQPVSGNMDVVLKFGEEYDDSDDEVIVLPHRTHSFNVAQLLFELVLLHIPLKKVNPDLEEEEIRKAYELLEAYAPEEKEEIDDEEENKDPRWDKLKDLLN